MIDIIIVLVALLALSIWHIAYKTNKLVGLEQANEILRKNNSYKIYPTLKEIIDGDLLKDLKDEDRIAYHLDNHRKALGDKYLIFSTVKEFRLGVEWAKQYVFKIEQELLWGNISSN